MITCNLTKTSKIGHPCFPPVVVSILSCHSLLSLSFHLPYAFLGTSLVHTYIVLIIIVVSFQRLTVSLKEKIKTCEKQWNNQGKIKVMQLLANTRNTTFIALIVQWIVQSMHTWRNRSVPWFFVCHPDLLYLLSTLTRFGCCSLISEFIFMGIPHANDLKWN